MCVAMHNLRVALCAEDKTRARHIAPARIFEIILLLIRRYFLLKRFHARLHHHR